MDEQGLFQTMRAFQESRTLLSALELDVFSAIPEGGATASEVAAQRQTDPRATEMLLDALVSLSALIKLGGRFRNTQLGRRLSSRADGGLRDAALHLSHLWRSWSTLTECVRSGTAVSHRDMNARDDDWTVPFIAAMHRNAAERAPGVVSAIGVSGAARMLDVGGGSGAYSIAFALANPLLQVEMIDLSSVLPIAQRHIAQAGLEDRVRTRSGDLRTDALGEGFDLVLVSAICHMLDADENRDLIRRCYAATAGGGRLIVHDFFLNPDRTGPRPAALFALNMLVGTPRGTNYTEDEYRTWMDAAGYQGVERRELDGPTDLLVGTRSAR